MSKQIKQIHLAAGVSGVNNGQHAARPSRPGPARGRPHDGGLRAVTLLAPHRLDVA
jgi:hypothetical protein